MSIFSVDDNVVSSVGYTPDSKTQATIETVSVTPTTSSEMTISNSKNSTVTVAGNRAAHAFIRPAPVYTAGIIVRYGFDLTRVTFELELDAAESTAENTPTEIFVPPLHFPRDEMTVTISGGKWEYDEPSKVLKWWHNEGEQKIKIVGIKALGVEVEDGDFVPQLCDKVCAVM